MKVYVVDNGGQWTHLEKRMLKYLKADVEMVPNTTPVEEISDADAVVLSGGAPGGACDVESMGNNDLYIDALGCPILGICAGMQLMCQHFGSRVMPMAVSSGGEVVDGAHGEFGTIDVKILRKTGIFEGLPDTVVMGVSHSDEVKECPEGFVVTACSDSCGIEAVECESRPLFGVQFHPEVKNSGEEGIDIFANFLKIAERYKKA